MKKHNKKFYTLQGHPRKKNLIDFPCSSIWQDHYANEGYTGYQDRPQSQPSLQGRSNTIEKETSLVADEVTELHSRIQSLEEQLEKFKQPPPKEARTDSPRPGKFHKQPFSGVEEKRLNESA